MATLVLGKSARIEVTFYDWAPENTIGSLVDPDSVDGIILNGNNVQIGTFAPSNIDVGLYDYTWVPDALGDYIIRFVGHFTDGDDTVEEAFEVVAADVPTEYVRLGDDYSFSFMPELDPMYFDIEDILSVYPDASNIETAQLVHYFSNQVVSLTKSTTINDTGYEYVRAATLCSLSKVYDLADNEMTFTLGDMTVVTQRFSKINLGRANATTWCELAAVLRREMLNKSGRTGIRATTKGFLPPMIQDPVPVRPLKDKG